MEVARKIKQNSAQLVTSARGCTMQAVAKRVGSAAGYLRGTPPADILADVEQLISRSPERALLAAAAAGIVIGAVLRGRR